MELAQNKSYIQKNSTLRKNKYDHTLRMVGKSHAVKLEMFPRSSHRSRDTIDMLRKYVAWNLIKNLVQ